MKSNWILIFAFLVTLCGCEAPNTDGLNGTVRIDGSSTVFPITMAVAEEFQKAHPNVNVPVGVSGTGGGFKKFSIGECDINDASRPIKEKEIAKCMELGIEFLEISVAYDGLSVVTHPDNDFVDQISIEELKKIWHPDSAANSWSQVREGWPDTEIELFGPGSDSGTFDYFTKVVNGKEQLCRSDYMQSEDDNVLVKGVSGDKDSLAFFGYVYYKENEAKLKIVPVSDNGEPAVTPDESSINDGTYKPLSRPIFIYLSSKSAVRPEVQEFVKFYLANAETLVSEVGYVPLPKNEYDKQLLKFEAFVEQSKNNSSAESIR
ncbi:MAG: PstS family phosphate ABC transporter substrate-binding protein [Planctomycetota bacterium]|nr:PstS family phosphate ABC transporter substrate-binding protein [Planctomycetota bacterium]